MVQVYVFPNSVGLGGPIYYNYWGYASTPNGIVYGIIITQIHGISFEQIVFTPSTYTYNGSTYYTYDVGVKQSYALLTYPNQVPQIYDNVVYYASGSYIYAYDLILGSTIGSVLSSIMPSIIDTRDGMIFSYNSSTIFYTSLQYPILNSLASWSSVIMPYTFYSVGQNYPIVVANGSLYIPVNYNAVLVANANNPNIYTVINVPAIPVSQYNGSLYALKSLPNNANQYYVYEKEIYVYNSSLNVIASYIVPDVYTLYNYYVVPMTSDYMLIPRWSNGLSRIDIYNIVSGSIVSLYRFDRVATEYAYSNKYGVYFMKVNPLTILVPDNPLAVDVYTSQYAYNKIYIIASVSIANTVPVSSYLVRFYYSSVPNYDYNVGYGNIATVHGAVHLHDVMQYIGSSYTNASGLASILFTLPNANQKLYYYVEVEQGV